MTGKSFRPQKDARDAAPSHRTQIARKRAVQLSPGEREGDEGRTLEPRVGESAWRPV